MMDGREGRHGAALFTQLSDRYSEVSSHHSMALHYPLHRFMLSEAPSLYFFVLDMTI